jgi:uncharacterized membrane protein YecN with MAPEG domain
MVTGFYAALLSGLLLVLLGRIIRKRWVYKIGIGDGGNHDLAKAMRAHGNFIETVPWVLILMVVMESNGISDMILHSYGATLVLARSLHAWGMTQTSGSSFGRMSGMILTMTLIIVGAITCFVTYVMA